MAISLIEHQSPVAADSDKLDWAVVDLSIRALLSNRKTLQSSNATPSISDEISDIKVREIFDSASIFLSPNTGSEAIAESKKIDRVSDQLLLLRQWLSLHSNSDDAISVVEHTLNLCLATTAYSPTSTFFLDISQPLPYAKDRATVSNLIGLLDGQKELAFRAGPTVDYVRFQLCLAEAESTHAFDGSESRLLELYLDVIEGIHDHSTHAVCLAWFAAAVTRIDKDKQLEAKHGMKTLMETELHKYVVSLLLSTAEHFEAAKPLIEALGVYCPDTALDICLELNTCYRRDRAINLLIETMMEHKHIQPDYDFCCRAISTITDIALVDDTKLSVAKRYSKDIDRLEPTKQSLSAWIDYFSTVSNPDIRAEIWVSLYKALCNSCPPDSEQELSRTIALLHDAWEEIDSSWARIDMGYRIASGIGKNDTKLSNQYMDELFALRKDTLFESTESADAIFIVINLAILAFNAIIRSKIDDPNDIERLSAYISRITSKFSRAILWSRVCCALYLNGRSTDAKALVSSKIRPILESITNKKSRAYFNAYSAISPALWISHKESTLSTISSLPATYQDRACTDILSFVIKKALPGLPYDEAPRHVFELDYTDFLEAIDVLGCTDNDTIIYYNIKRLTDTLHGLRKQARLSFNQSEDIISKIKLLITRKLPAKNYIAHEGYKIACEVLVARVERSNMPVWEELIDRTNNIDNLADRIFLLAHIASNLRSKQNTLRLSLLNQAKELVSQVPSEYDRLDRYEIIADIAWEIDSTISKSCIQSVFKDNPNTDDVAIRDKQRDLIDLAYRIDADFAASLASVSDTDPARARTKTRVNERVRYLKLKSSFSNETSDIPKAEDKLSSHYPEIAWKELGSLISKRGAPSHIGRVKEVLQIGTHFPLEEAFSIYCWCIENLNVMYGPTTQSIEYIKPAFEAILSNLDLLCYLFSTSTNIKKSNAWTASVSKDKTAISIHLGEKERALNFIRDWLHSAEPDYLIICDPYFGPEDLVALQIIRESNPRCQIKILTSEKHQNNEKIQKPWDESYQTYWRRNISEQPPPDCDIVIVGIASSGELPIHDRWWITDGTALRLGTSFRSLGNSKLTEISKMNADQAYDKKMEVEKYIGINREREYLGDRIRYSMFSL